MAQLNGEDLCVRPCKLTARSRHHAIGNERRQRSHVRIPELRERRIARRHVRARPRAPSRCLKPPALIHLVVAPRGAVDRAVRQRHTPAMYMVETVQTVGQNALFRRFQHGNRPLKPRHGHGTRRRLRRRLRCILHRLSLPCRCQGLANAGVEVGQIAARRAAFAWRLWGDGGLVRRHRELRKKCEGCEQTYRRAQYSSFRSVQRRLRAWHRGPEDEVEQPRGKAGVVKKRNTRTLATW